MATLDKNKIVRGKNGGKRPNAGVYKGFKYPKTIEKEKIKSEIDKVIMLRASKIVDAQYIMSQGYHVMIEFIKVPGGIPEQKQVSDPKRIQELLDLGEYGKDYVIVLGARPDPKAGDMLLNRTFGKPTESLEVGNKDGRPLSISLFK